MRLILGGLVIVMLGMATSACGKKGPLQSPMHAEIEAPVSQMI